jgi:hypothetical protein
LLQAGRSGNCGRSLAGVAGFEPAGGLDVCVVCCTVKTKEQAKTIQTKKEVQKKRRNERRNSEIKIVPVGKNFSHPSYETVSWDFHIVPRISLLNFHSADRCHPSRASNRTP